MREKRTLCWLQLQGKWREGVGSSPLQPSRSEKRPSGSPWGSRWNTRWSWCPAGDRAAPGRAAQRSPPRWHPCWKVPRWSWLALQGAQRLVIGFFLRCWALPATDIPPRSSDAISGSHFQWCSWAGNAAWPLVLELCVPALPSRSCWTLERWIWACWVQPIHSTKLHPQAGIATPELSAIPLALRSRKQQQPLGKWRAGSKGRT